MKEGAKGKREKGRKEMVKRQKRSKGENCGRRGERENNLMNRKV